MAGFQSFPSWWTRNGSMSRFHGGKQAGTSIAALKCYLAIALLADFETRTAKVSYTDFIRLTGLSKPMIPRALTKLVAEELIEIDKSGHTSIYELALVLEEGKSGLTKRWAKIPEDRLRAALKSIPNKGDKPLGALKVYIQLLAGRSNSSPYVRLTYEKLRERTGLQKLWIRPSLDILFNHMLVHITKSEDLDFPGEKHAHNIYRIVGDLRL